MTVLTRDAADRLVEDNLGLATAIARDYLGRGVELEDLIAEARVALVIAAQTYDPDFRRKGTDLPIPFAVYARWEMHIYCGNAVRKARLEREKRQNLQAFAGDFEIEPGFEDDLADFIWLEDVERELTEDQQLVVRLYFGLDDKPLSKDDIATFLGRRNRWVADQLEQALSRLQKKAAGN